jgi:hypothetical protein
MDLWLQALLTLIFVIVGFVVIYILHKKNMI